MIFGLEEYGAMLVAVRNLGHAIDAYRDLFQNWADKR